MKPRKQAMHSLTVMQRKRFEKAKGKRLRDVEELSGSIAVTQQPTLNHPAQAHGAGDIPALLSGLLGDKAESIPCHARRQGLWHGVGSWSRCEEGHPTRKGPEMLTVLMTQTYVCTMLMSAQNWWNNSFGPNLIDWPPKCHEVMMYLLAQHTELAPTVFSVTETLAGLSSRALPRFEPWYYQNSYPRKK